MTRRRALLGVIAGGLGATAGCLNAVLEGDPEADSEPEQNETASNTTPDTGPQASPENVIRSYFTRMTETDVEGLNTLVHPEKNSTISREEIHQFRESSVTFHNIETRTVDDGAAMVQVALEFDYGAQTSHDSNTLEVRTHEDKWYIWGEPETGIPTGLEPVGVVETFWESVDDGDFFTANALVHPDSPEGEIDPASEESWQQISMDIQDVSVTNESTDSVTVDIVMDWTTETEEGTEETTIESQYELRPHESEWRLWEDSFR